VKAYLDKEEHTIYVDKAEDYISIYWLGRAIGYALGQSEDYPPELSWYIGEASRLDPTKLPILPSLEDFSGGSLGRKIIEFSRENK